MDGFFGWSFSPSDSLNRAFELFQKALKLDEQDENAHAKLGNFYLVVNRQYEKAISEGKRAILLNPNFADGHASLAMTMMYSGDFAEAVALMKKALRLNPNAQPIFLFTLAESYIFLGRCEEALETINKLHELASKGRIPMIFPLLEYCFVYHELCKEEEARAYMAETLKISPTLSTPVLKRLRPYKNPEHLQRVLDACLKAGMPEKSPVEVLQHPIKSKKF